MSGFATRDAVRYRSRHTRPDLALGVGRQTEPPQPSPLPQHEPRNCLSAACRMPVDSRRSAGPASASRTSSTLTSSVSSRAAFIGALQPDRFALADSLISLLEDFRLFPLAERDRATPRREHGIRHSRLSEARERASSTRSPWSRARDVLSRSVIY